MTTQTERIMAMFDDAIESARLQGGTDAKKGFGIYTEQDSRFNVAMHQSIAAKRAALLAALHELARAGEAVAIKDAVGCVLEGWTLPEPVRKILETAYYATPQPAQPSEPAQPVAQPLPLTDAWIRERTTQPWIFETVKQWVKEIEAAHGIGGAR